MFAYSLMMAGTSMMVLLAGIIGTDFAPSTDLAMAGRSSRLHPIGARLRSFSVAQQKSG